MKKIPYLLAFLIALSGCATLFNGGTSSQLVVEYATMKVIEKGDATDRHARAQQILTIANEAHTFLDQSNVTLAVLEAAVRARLAGLHLQPSDQFLADALVQSVAADLQAKIGDGVLNPDQVVKVNTVLGWVETAASFY